MVFEAHGMSFPCTEHLLFNYAKLFHSMAPLRELYMLKSCCCFWKPVCFDFISSVNVFILLMYCSLEYLVCILIVSLCVVDLIKTNKQTNNK